MTIAFQTPVLKAEIIHRAAIIDLLQSEKLPVEDLPATLDHFLIVVDEGKLAGVIGWELYDNYALLRSMAVDKEYRNKSIAAALITALEKKAAQAGVQAMYLLTETAATYFEKKGYTKVTRNEVPEPLRASSEFKSVCPVSAIVMKKEISQI